LVNKIKSVVLIRRDPRGRGGVGGYWGKVAAGGIEQGGGIN